MNFLGATSGRLLLFALSFRTFSGLLGSVLQRRLTPVTMPLTEPGRFLQQQFVLLPAPNPRSCPSAARHCKILWVPSHKPHLNTFVSVQKVFP